VHVEAQPVARCGAYRSACRLPSRGPRRALRKEASGRACPARGREPPRRAARSKAFAGAHFADRRELRREHHLVGVALRRAEPASPGSCASRPRRKPSSSHPASIKQQVAAAQRRIVGDVVQHAGIRPPGDDRPVGGELRAAAPELIEQARLRSRTRCVPGASPASRRGARRRQCAPRAASPRARARP